MKRSVVVMKNITFREHNYLRYSAIQLNKDKQIKKFSSRDILQTKLDVFEKIIQLAYMEMLDYAMKKYSEQVQLPVNIEDMFHEYDQTIQNGVPILNKLINQLNHKQVSEKSFQYMKQIFDHQVKMTKRIIDKDLSIERLETVYNLLLNVPYYLESDLEIESLPNVNVVEIGIEERQIRETSIYDLNKNSNFYKTGA